MDIYTAVSDITILRDSELAPFVLTANSKTLKIHGFSVTHTRFYDNIVPPIEWNWYTVNDLGIYDDEYITPSSLDPLGSTLPPDVYVLKYNAGDAPVWGDVVFAGNTVSVSQAVGMGNHLGSVVQLAKGQEIVCPPSDATGLYVYNNHSDPLRVISTVTFSV